VQFSDKVVRVCDLNRANDRDAPRNKTQLINWLGLAGGRLSKSYKAATATLHLSLERAVVMALGFGPAEADFDQGENFAWSRWVARWGELWRNAQPKELADCLESEPYFVPRPRDDPRLTALIGRIRRNTGAASSASPVPGVAANAAAPAGAARGLENRYLDRLASLEVTGVRTNGGDHRLLATCTFGTVEVQTEDATYLVSINRCHADILLTADSFEPCFEQDVVRSRSSPVLEMSIKRESSKINHPSWLVKDPRPKTPLNGEYCDVELGVVRGPIGADDEASIVVTRAGFAIHALTGGALEEFGIVSSLLRFLVSEHVGEIEMRGSYRYHLSARPIEWIGTDD
jgi:hypothetical protein